MLERNKYLQAAKRSNVGTLTKEAVSQLTTDFRAHWERLGGSHGVFDDMYKAWREAPPLHVLPGAPCRLVWGGG